MLPHRLRRPAHSCSLLLFGCALSCLLCPAGNILLLLLWLLRTGLQPCWLHAQCSWCCGLRPSHKVEGGTEQASKRMAEVAPQRWQRFLGQTGAEVSCELLHDIASHADTQTQTQASRNVRKDTVGGVQRGLRALMHPQECQGTLAVYVSVCKPCCSGDPRVPGFSWSWWAVCACAKATAWWHTAHAQRLANLLLKPSHATAFVYDCSPAPWVSGQGSGQ
jgi:hypothetical protein